jgi:hypothetical protein
MQRVLRQLARGETADAHCRSMSDHGGLTATLGALQRHGFLKNGRLTKAGRAAAAGKVVWPRMPKIGRISSAG